MTPLKYRPYFTRSSVSITYRLLVYPINLDESIKARSSALTPLY